MDDDDEFDYSDVDLDDLPTTTLQHLEASALHATQQQQQQQQQESDSDYGLNDGGEVVNLDDDYPANPPTHGSPPHNDYMDFDEPPRRSQADPAQLLHRIKLVRCILVDPPLEQSTC